MRVLSTVSVPSLSVIANFSYVFLENTDRASSLWHPAVMKYCDLSIMRFLILPCDGAVSYQCSNSCLLHPSRDIPVPFPVRFCTCPYDYVFCHFIDESAFGYASAYVAFQRSAVVEWTPCDTDGR